MMVSKGSKCTNGCTHMIRNPVRDVPNCKVVPINAPIDNFEYISCHTTISNSF